MFCSKLTVFISLLLSTAVASQNRPETLIVRAGEDPIKVLPFEYLYLNKNFQDGCLEFQLGRKSGTYKFNLYLLTGEVRFISEKKDTMTVQQDVTVKYLHLGKDKYYHDINQGYFKILARDTLGMLTSRVEFSHYVPTNVAYGTVKHKTTAISTEDRGKEQTFERTLRYHLIDSRGSVSAFADKTAFIKLFHNGEDQIKAFIKENKISFKKEADLIKLFEYCASLGLRP
jgi:hypothetical protein